MTRRIIIIGAPRSGSSLLARLAVHLGAYGGNEDDLEWMKGNEDIYGMDTTHIQPQGNWEHPVFARLNRNLVEEMSGVQWGLQYWGDVEAYWKSEQGQYVAEKYRGYGEALIGAMEDGARDKFGVWVLKDPRASFTIPYWRDKIPGLHVIQSWRSPENIEKSMIKTGVEPHKDFIPRLVKSYIDAGELFADDVFDYDRWFIEPVQQAVELSLALYPNEMPHGVPWLIENIAHAGIIDKKHRHFGGKGQ